MIEFHRVPPENIQFLPFKAIKYIEGAIQRTPANVTRLDVVLDVISKGHGDLYLISRDDEIIGITYLLTYDTAEGKVLSPVLTAGYKMASWSQDYADFLYKYAASSNIKILRFIGRRGWTKMFPKAKIIGYVCEIVK